MSDNTSNDTSYLCQVPKILGLNLTNDVTLPIGSDNIVNLLESNCFTKTITANTTFTFTSPRNCMTFVMILTNPGLYTITWPNNVKWSNNNPPVLSSSGIDILTFITPDSGVTYYGNISVTGVSTT